MKACPLVFQHPSEAQQLNGLGPKLCDRLTDKLRGYCVQNGLPEPEAPHQSRRPASDLGFLLYGCDANQQQRTNDLRATIYQKANPKPLRNRGSRSPTCRRYGLDLMRYCLGWER